MQNWGLTSGGESKLPTREEQGDEALEEATGSGRGTGEKGQKQAQVTQ